MAKTYEYYIRQLDVNDYQVSKFDSMDGGEQPLASYDIQFTPSNGRWKCNCQSAVYRQRQHLLDKHVRMVIEWINGGKSTMAIIL